MRSDLVKKGSTRAAHRSLFYALGFSDEDLKKAAFPLKFLPSAFATVSPWATKE